VQLAPIEVGEAPPQGLRGSGFEAFEERRRMGFGRFLDCRTLRRNEHRRLGSLVRQASVRVASGSTGLKEWTVGGGAA
jgi:hypothetical protein